MLKKSLMYFAISLLCITGGSAFARNILEKKITYLDNTGKTGQARFWVIYLGSYDLQLTRKYPGEAEQKVDASMNLQLLSSGYVEGNGYGSKGKMESRPTLVISNADGQQQINLDSIDYIFDYGSKVTLINGKTGDLLIDIEGDKQPNKKFIMREYKLTNFYGEEVLKEGSTETPIAAFTLTKDGAARMTKAQAATEKK